MDLYDKIVISVTLVIMTILCVFNNFCYAVEDVGYEVVSNIEINPSLNFFRPFTGSSTGYFPLEKGYIYKFIPKNSSVHLAVSSKVPEAYSNYNYIKKLEVGESYSYISSSSSDFLYFSFSWAGGDFEITRELIPGMSGSIALLSSTLNPDSLWGVFGSSIPYVCIVVLVGFGFYLIFRIIKGVSKGRAKI